MKGRRFDDNQYLTAPYKKLVDNNDKLRGENLRLKEETKKWQAEMENLTNHKDSLRGRNSRVALKICKKNSRNLVGANQVTVQAIACRDMMDAKPLAKPTFHAKSFSSQSEGDTPEQDSVDTTVSQSLSPNGSSVEIIPLMTSGDTSNSEHLYHCLQSTVNSPTQPAPAENSPLPPTPAPS